MQAGDAYIRCRPVSVTRLLHPHVETAQHNSCVLGAKVRYTGFGRPCVSLHGVWDWGGVPFSMHGQIVSAPPKCA